MRFLLPQPITIGKILDTSIKLYQAALPKLIAFILINLVFQVGFIFLSISLNIDSTKPAAQFAQILANLPLLLSVGLIYSFFYFAILVGMIYRIDNVENQQEDSLQEAFQFGLKKIFVVFWGYILFVIAFVLGSLLLIIPGIILAVSLSFFAFFIVLESMGAYKSLRASHSLIWGHWWRTLTVYMAPGIVMMILLMSFGAITSLLGSATNPVFQIINQGISALITPYFLVLAYIQFHDLKLRKSGGDLELRLGK